MSEFETPPPQKPGLKDRLLSMFKKKTVKQEPQVPEGAESKVSQKKAKGKLVTESPEDQLIRQQNMESLYKSLTTREREVFELIFVEGKNNAEAARSLGVSDEAVRQRRFAIESKARATYKK